MATLNFKIPSAALKPRPMLSRFSSDFYQQSRFASPMTNALDLIPLSRPRAIVPITRRTISQRSFYPRSSKSDVPSSSFKYPPMKRKPRWWWRMLAGIPYLMPLHCCWVFSETAYNLHPFLECIEYYTLPFLKAVGSQLPSWFPMAYFLVAYLGVVRRKELPHFFRFHVVMGMLLEITLQAVGMAWKFIPKSVYWGKIGMHFWAAFTFGYLFTVVECLWCAIAGMYADVPFLCDAAYTHIPYD